MSGTVAAARSTAVAAGRLAAARTGEASAGAIATGTVATRASAARDGLVAGFSGRLSGRFAAGLARVLATRRCNAAARGAAFGHVPAAVFGRVLEARRRAAPAAALATALGHAARSGESIA